MKPSLLLVEDNPDDAELIVRAFKITLQTRKLVHVEDGAAALDFLFSRGLFRGREGDMPEVMILDLNMPGIPGHQVLRQIRADQRTAAIPIVILTSDSHEEAMVKSLALGANYFLHKHHDLSRFENEVLQLELHWLSHGGPGRL
jgi:two-component system response regulator